MATSPLEDLVADPDKGRALFHVLKTDLELRLLDLTPLLRAVYRHCGADSVEMRLLRQWIARNDFRDGLLWQLGLIDVEPDQEVYEALRGQGFALRDPPDWETGELEAGRDVESE